MLQRRGIYKQLLHHVSRGCVKSCNGFTLHIKGSSCRTLCGVCDTYQSPELPEWIKFPHGECPIEMNSEDDFTIPSLSKRLGNQSHGWVTRASRHEIVDSGINEVTMILQAHRHESLATIIEAISKCKIDVSEASVNKILKRFNNDWVPAFNFFLWALMQEGYYPSSDSFDTMVDILGKARRFDLMWALIDHMRQYECLISLNTMTKVMRRLAGSGFWLDAIRAFHLIKSFGLSQNTQAMNTLLDSLCKEGGVEHAQDVFLELRDRISPDASSFNILIHGWCKARKLDKACLTMMSMENFGFHPCVISYTSLVEAYCHEKNFRKVDDILKEMHVKGCPPNIVTYTIIMHAHGKAKQTQEALKIYETMKINGCSPDTSFYNSLIYILSRAGRLDDAHDIYVEMFKSGSSPNVTTYNTMITSACEYLQEDQALQVLKEMEERLCRPNLETYAPLLKMCCRKDRTETLHFLLEDMLKKDLSLDFGTYTLLVHGLCHRRKLKRSCLFFKEMVLKGFFPRQNTYNMLMMTLENQMMVEEKERIQELMIQAEHQNHSMVFNKIRKG